MSTGKIVLKRVGNETPLFTNIDKMLTPQGAGDILIQNLPNIFITETPYSPQAGSIFVYSDSGDDIKKTDWRSDGYTWRNYGKSVYIVYE